MKKIIWSSVGVLVLILLVFLFLWEQPDQSELIIKPKKGNFYITVVATGTIQAVNSINITGPSNLFSVGIYGDIKISELIPEGTVVDSGDFVAKLDKSILQSKIRDNQLSLEKIQNEYTQAKLDSALELSAARDHLENLKFELEEKKILKEQSKYEPPATLRQAEINYQRTLRTYKQELKNYKTKVKKSITKISTVYADLQKAENTLNRMLEILKGFTIYSPSKGMIIYRRDWYGRTIEAGSEISQWDPVVATLPDLTKMESISFINEVDIQKIVKGQYVEITLDANPDKKFTGKVTRVANIGEELKGSETKVFRVNVEINEQDSTLLPSMTSSNKFFIKTIENALYIPLESLHETKVDDNKIKFVYKKDNGSIVKQEVKVGDRNDNEIVILEGLNEDSEILLNDPLNSNELELIRLKKETKKQAKK